MKKLLLALALPVLAGHAAFASHGMGGEITWTCNGGSYIFQLKFYRDCNGIPGPQTMTLQNNAGVSIPMSLISQTDISPVGSNDSGIDSCSTCAGAIGNTVGVVEEFVFQSGSINIPGTPPPSGWIFWFSSCCRSNSLTNVNGGGGFGFALRAKMYPFTGQVGGQCSDASPQFAERPSIAICTGYPYTYNPFAWDAERDSLNYSFDILLDDNGSPPVTPVPFATGYSVSSPLPSPAQNPGNIPATVNPFSGLISFTSFTQGYFATCVKVSEYKCGQLAAEIFREINIVLIGGCIIPPGAISNNPPALDPPFADTSGVLAVYDTTVHAGDTLLFLLGATDNDLHPVDTNQEVTFYSVSEQYGTGYTNPSTGCLIPPCATLTPSPPLTVKSSVSTQFDWITTPAHLGLNFGCVYMANVYYFLLKGNDNYCPANGQRVETMKITVIPNVPQPPVVNNGGTLTCLLFTGNYSYQWFLDRFAIPGATSVSYTPVTTGFYQVLAYDPTTLDGNYSSGIFVNATGVYELPGSLARLDVFPNPSYDGSFTVSFESLQSQHVSICVTDMTGRSVYSSEYKTEKEIFKETMRIKKPAGVYFIEVKTTTGQIVKKLLVL